MLFDLCLFGRGIFYSEPSMHEGTMVQLHDIINWNSLPKKPKGNKQSSEDLFNFAIGYVVVASMNA